jgi:hypothetical protein
MPISQQRDPQNGIGKWWNAGMGFAETVRSLKTRTRCLENQVHAGARIIDGLLNKPGLLLLVVMLLPMLSAGSHL